MFPIRSKCPTCQYIVTDQCREILDDFLDGHTRCQIIKHVKTVIRKPLMQSLSPPLPGTRGVMSR